MYTITRKVTRPSTELEFRNMMHETIAPEIKSYWVSTYKETMKCMLVDVSLSDDGLEMLTTMIWDSKDSWNEYQADPVLIAGLFTPIHAHQDENGFTRELVSEEEI